MKDGTRVHIEGEVVRAVRIIAAAEEGWIFLEELRIQHKKLGPDPNFYSWYFLQKLK